MVLEEWLLSSSLKSFVPASRFSGILAEITWGVMSAGRDCGHWTGNWSFICPEGKQNDVELHGVLDCICWSQQRPTTKPEIVRGLRLRCRGDMEDRALQIDRQESVESVVRDRGA